MLLLIFTFKLINIKFCSSDTTLTLSAQELWLVVYLLDSAGKEYFHHCRDFSWTMCFYTSKPTAYLNREIPLNTIELKEYWR